MVSELQIKCKPHEYGAKFGPKRFETHIKQLEKVSKTFCNSNINVTIFSFTFLAFRFQNSKF